MRTKLALALAWTVACGGGGEDPIEAPACTGALYDPCDTEHDCMSERCQSFDGLLVCSQPCTPGDPASCPAHAGGEVVTCTPEGACKPARANDCAR